MRPKSPQHEIYPLLLFMLSLVSLVVVFAKTVAVIVAAGFVINCYYYHVDVLFSLFSLYLLLFSLSLLLLLLLLSSILPFSLLSYY